MIRLFLNFCKHFHKINKLSEIELLKHLQDSLFKEISNCPVCGAPIDALHKDGHYDRDFICYENGKPVYYRITIHCLECSSCDHSHALEPSVIVPYSSFSLGFLLNVIYARLTKRFSTIEKLCQHFNISISTFYRIYKCFLTDSILLKHITEVSRFIEIWQNRFKEFHNILYAFHKDCGYSFLQPRVRLRPKIIMKEIPPDISRYIDNG